MTYTGNIPEKDIIRLQDAIHEVSTYNFSNYSYNSFYRRIEKIIEDFDTDIDSLIENIREDYNFLEKVVRNITVNTTEIFRDPETWFYVRQAIEKRYAQKDCINIWHAGCSTGQEVYSMMIILNEMNLLDKASIYASDINQKVLNTAISGKYKYHEMINYLDNFDKALNESENMKKFYPPVEISKYIKFTKFNDTVQMADFLVEKPLFIKHDIVSCKNIFDKKFDIIMCRNVLIYFNHELQNRVITFFYENLDKNGSLIIGKHEGIMGPIAANFDKRDSIYYRSNTYWSVK
jgi:chemotaxis protein methyltransferase CheR